MFVVKSARSQLRIRDLFSDAFKKHPSGAGARMFVAGTPGAVPTPDRMLSEWDKPWLFTRVIGIGLLFSLMSYLLYLQFDHPLGVILPVTFGALVMPLGILVFYWEISIPRDIPIYKVAEVFLIGGVLSLLCSLPLSFDGPAYLVGPLAEEPGKVIALAVFIYLLNTPYIFDGLLIGAAVGAGFAAFENIYYAFYVTGSMDNLILRSLLAIGGHVSWAAIEGGALAWVKGNDRLRVKHFFQGKFLLYLLAAMGMHCLWNMPVGLFPLPLVLDLKYLLLSAAAVYTSFSLIKKAIAQVLRVIDGGLSLPSEAASPRRAPREPKLLVLRGPNAGSSIGLSGRMVIGRDPRQCQYVIPAETGNAVSRVHCAVEKRADGVYLMDLDSTNGTYIQHGGKWEKLPANTWIKLTGRFCIGSMDTLFSLEE